MNTTPSTLPCTIVALVHTHSSVVYRVISLCRRYRMQIDSVTVTPTETGEMARLTLVVQGALAAPLVAQLRKLVDVRQIDVVPQTHPVPPSPPFSHTAQADGGS